MRAALIPPKWYEHTATANTDFHLVLAQIEEPSYVTAFGNTPESDFIVMDNGAAEGEMVSDDVLMQRAHIYGADEIVLPDVMTQAHATVERVRNFFKHQVVHESNRFMAVAQSEGDMGQLLHCVQEFSKFEQIKTIGIPRHLVEYNKYGRLQALNWLGDWKERFEFHLLGTNVKYLGEVLRAAQDFPWVRSVDTSLPYNYAINGLELFDGQVKISRPDQYFTKDRNIDPVLLKNNIDTYMRWARGEGSRG